MKATRKVAKPKRKSISRSIKKKVSKPKVKAKPKRKPIFKSRSVKKKPMVKAKPVKRKVAKPVKKKARVSSCNHKSNHNWVKDGNHYVRTFFDKNGNKYKALATTKGWVIYDGDYKVANSERYGEYDPKATIGEVIEDVDNYIYYNADAIELKYGVIGSSMMKGYYFMYVCETEKDAEKVIKLLDKTQEVEDEFEFESLVNEIERISTGYFDDFGDRNIDEEGIYKGVKIVNLDDIGSYYGW